MVEAVYVITLTTIPKAICQSDGDLPHCQTQGRSAARRVSHQAGHLGDVRRHAARHRHRRTVPESPRSAFWSASERLALVAAWCSTPRQLATPYSCTSIRATGMRYRPVGECRNATL